ncbi:MAG: hypothetical protein IT379_30485 [Deltaproteobacteria bacterium]|nr:hypothetical protein [Deltaproteobacteria bacterium]
MPRPTALEPLYVPIDARDAAVAVLDALARVRLVSLGSLRAYAATEGLDPTFLDTWIAAKLIVKTVIVTDAVRATSLEIVALTPAGARALSEITTRNVQAVAPSRLKRSGQKLTHDAGVGDVALAFVAAGHAGVAAVMGVETDTSVLSTSVVMQGSRGALRVPLQGDAYVLLRGANGPTGLLIEFDRATIAPKKMGAKFAAYVEWRRTGGPARAFSIKALRVLTVVPDARRLEKLHGAALDATGGKRSGFLIFAEAKDFTAADPRRLAEPVARQLGDDTFVSLVGAPAPPGVARQRDLAAA